MLLSVQEGLMKFHLTQTLWSTCEKKKSVLAISGKSLVSHAPTPLQSYERPLVHVSSMWMSVSYHNNTPNVMMVTLI